MTMVVAYWMPHNEGVESGIFDRPGQSTELDLVDLYEVDGTIETFASMQEAEDWIKEKQAERNAPPPKRPSKSRRLQC